MRPGDALETGRTGEPLPCAGERQFREQISGWQHQPCADNSVEVVEAFYGFLGGLVSDRSSLVMGCYNTPVDPQTVCK